MFGPERQPLSAGPLMSYLVLELTEGHAVAPLQMFLMFFKLLLLLLLHALIL